MEGVLEGGSLSKGILRARALGLQDRHCGTVHEQMCVGAGCEISISVCEDLTAFPQDLLEFLLRCLCVYRSAGLLVFGTQKHCWLFRRSNTVILLTPF